MVGKSLSHYTILEELGRGGMGIVYKAEDTKLDRTVAIKILPAAALASDDDRARFYREAKAAAQLHHPHIASVFEIDEAIPEDAKDDDLRPFIAMEYIEGETLNSRIQAGPLKLDDAIRIASQIASGLGAAHEKNIVHRDVKAGNVMLTEKGDAKILDFGLAQTEASTKLTRLGSTLGTVSYMSPEQARGEEVDRRTDVWALGVVLYEMVAGHSPFPGDYEQAVVYEILNTDPELLTALRTGVPLELERIVDKCLQKDRDRRYQHTDDLITDLAGIAIEPRMSSVRTRTGMPASVPKKSSPWGYIGAILLGSAVTYLALSLIGVTDVDSDIPTVTHLRRLTIEPYREYDPMIHPDGNLVVYAAGESYDRTKLFYRSVSGSSANPLTNSFSEVEQQPSFSPDGNSVLFISGRSLYTVDFPAGVPTPLLRRRIGEGSIVSASFSPDGKQIAYSTVSDSIFVLNRSTREQRFLTLVREPSKIAWSPDGSRIALVSGNANLDGMNVAPSEILIVSLSDGNRTAVSDAEDWNLNPMWAPDGRGLFYISNRGGGRDIYYERISASSQPIGDPTRITSGLNLLSMDLSSDGSTIVGGDLYYNQNIWVSDISSEKVSSAKDAVPVTTGDQIIEGVILSHDGEWIAYDSNARGNQDIFVMPVNGGEPRQITSDPADDFVYSWSPDDQELAYHTFREGNRDVHTISLFDLITMPVATTEANERYPSWNADGSKIAFSYNAQEIINVYLSERQPNRGWSSPVPLFETDGSGAKFSPVEDVIEFVSGGALRIRDLQGAQDRKLLENTTLPYGCEVRTGTSNWSPDGKMVLFRTFGASCPGTLLAVPASGGTISEVLRLDGREWGFSHFSLGRDKIYYTLKEVHSDLWVMELSASQ